MLNEMILCLFLFILASLATVKSIQQISCSNNLVLEQIKRDGDNLSQDHIFQSSESFMNKSASHFHNFSLTPSLRKTSCPKTYYQAIYKKILRK